MAIESSDSFGAGAPQLLFEGRYYVDPTIVGRERTDDVSPDGQRFLMIKEPERPDPPPAAQPLTRR